ncbi:paired immunoglobulin-like type 2 receptor beta isoform X2 [Dama dama]|nr:paired immunoglobulin-like type 2 receptor beta isoform X2 [Dama dama]
MKQRRHLSAPEGGFIHIPFSFSYRGKLAKDPNVRISWRWKHFHGEFIYKMTPPFIHENFKNRIFLNWKKGQKTGSLWISDLQREDQSVYFCHVALDTLTYGKQRWQSIEGTNLTVTPGRKTTTWGPITTTTTAGLGGSEGKRSSKLWSLTMEATVGLALASVVLLKIPIVGLTVYLWWKRSKGAQTEARTPARMTLESPMPPSLSPAGPHQLSSASPPPSPLGTPGRDPVLCLKGLSSGTEWGPPSSQLRTGISAPHNLPGQTQTAQRPAGAGPPRT